MVCKTHKCKRLCISFVFMMYVLVLVFTHLTMILLYFMFSNANISRQKVTFFKMLHTVCVCVNKRVIRLKERKGKYIQNRTLELSANKARFIDVGTIRTTRVGLVVEDLE